MAKIPERGLIYKTSRMSYVPNYALVILMVFLLYLLWVNFHLTFTLTPKTINEFLPTMFVFIFIITITFLIEEPSIERFIRRYVVTNNEVTKIEGIIRKEKLSIPYQSVADIKLEQGVLGRIFGFGNVYITGVIRSEKTGGTETIKMKGIRHPDEAYRIIQNKINLMRGAIISRESSKKGKE